ncbi:amidohydrolase family protein [Formosa sp. S-31]|uniref:amidohydrolase family protein n=1 Tax=Formosa sp. S-31 TaxID=2790949 RepID=UPI003EBA9AA4
MIIDSHQHFWVYNEQKHDWIDDTMSAIRRNFLPEDLKAIYEAEGIDGCVAVQADQTPEETDFLLQLSQKHNFIKGVVGWLDLRAENLEAQLSKYEGKEKLKGFRHVVQGEPDHNFLLRPEFLKGISLLDKHNYTYDILIFPHQLGAALEFIRRFPKQKFVIDHIAKPYIKDGFFDGWAALIREIGKHENVFCKLSGMVTEADYKTWTPEQINPYMDVVLEAFGTERLLFGSDWPVCLVAGNYSEIKTLTTNYIAKLTPVEQAKIMGENAMQFYNL